MADNEFVWSPDGCFLCGATLAEPTKEHVFPKWLQERFNLWDKSLALLNESQIPYRQMVIPCCHDCNHGPLGTLEGVIGSAFDKGWRAVAELDPDQLFQWCVKIYYGNMYRELTLPEDRRKPEGGPIMPPDLLHGMKTLRTFVESIRIATEYIGKPYSLFILPLHTYESDKWQFWFGDTIGIGDECHLCLALWIGGTGLIAVLDDNQHQQVQRREIMASITGPPLHPIQFLEIVACVFYTESKRHKVTDYLTAEVGGKRQIICLPLSGNTHHEWNSEEFADVLTWLWTAFGIEESYFKQGQSIKSFLFKKDGTTLQLRDAQGSPI